MVVKKKKKTIKTKETKETNANLPAIAGGGDFSLGAVLERTPSVDLGEQVPPSPFLPYCYLTNERTNNQDPWVLVISKNGKETVVEAPYTMSHILTRPMVRRLEGSEYKDRYYTGGESEQKFNEIVEKLGDKKEADVDGEIWQRGFVHVFALIDEEGEITIATMEVAKSLENYWTGAFKEGDIRDKRGVVIEVTSHEASVKKSAKGFKYLASWKFTEWYSVDLPLKYMEIKEAWDRQQVQVQNFLKR